MLLSKIGTNIRAWTICVCTLNLSGRPCHRRAGGAATLVADLGGIIEPISAKLWGIIVHVASCCEWLWSSDWPQPELQILEAVNLSMQGFVSVPFCSALPCLCHLQARDRRSSRGWLVLRHRWQKALLNGVIVESSAQRLWSRHMLVRFWPSRRQSKIGSDLSVEAASAALGCNGWRRRWLHGRLGRRVPYNSMFRVSSSRH